LGCISEKYLVSYNESGYWGLFKSDDHGFSNPTGLYNFDKESIAMIGDSFTQGQSVHMGESIQAVLRDYRFNALSFGAGAVGCEMDSIIKIADAHNLFVSS